MQIGEVQISITSISFSVTLCLSGSLYFEFDVADLSVLFN